MYHIDYLESRSEISVSEISLSEDSGSAGGSTSQSIEVEDESNLSEFYDAHYGTLDLSRKVFKSKSIPLSYLYLDSNGIWNFIKHHLHGIKKVIIPEITVIVNPRKIKICG